MNTENFTSIARGTNPFELTTGLSTESMLALQQRIHFAQQTIRNTMVKLGHLRRPDNLLWALHNSGTYHPIGITRETRGLGLGSKTELRDITQDVRDGKIELQETDLLRFAITYPASGAIGQGYIRLQYLRNDPIAIAQMTRRALRDYENQQRAAEGSSVRYELQRLQKDKDQADRAHARKVEELQRKLEASNKRVGKKTCKQGTGQRELAGVTV